MNSKPVFSISVKDLSTSRKAYHFDIPTLWLQHALEDTDLHVDSHAPLGSLDIDLQKVGNDVVVQGHARANVITGCVRCLEDISLPLEAEITVLLSARGNRYRAVPDEQELTPEDLDREFFDGETVELDATVREHLILEVPMQPHCAVPCLKITTESTSHDAKPQEVVASDPRLAPLAALRSKLPK